MGNACLSGNTDQKTAPPPNRISDSHNYYKNRDTSGPAYELSVNKGGNFADPILHDGKLPALVEQGVKRPGRAGYQDDISMQTRSKAWQQTDTWETRADDTRNVNEQRVISRESHKNRDYSQQRRREPEPEPEVNYSNKGSRNQSSARQSESYDSNRGYMQTSSLRHPEGDSSQKTRYAPPPPVNAVPPLVASGEHDQKRQPGVTGEDAQHTRHNAEVIEAVEYHGSPKKKKKKSSKKHKRKHERVAWVTDDIVDTERLTDLTQKLRLLEKYRNFWKPFTGKYGDTIRVVIPEHGSYDNFISSTKTNVHEKDVEISSLSEQLKAEQDKNQTLLTRLSAVAASNLMDNNPNIADLSDGNRPTKLAECYKEIYDNLWTDAYTELTETAEKTEKEAVGELLQILVNVYLVCRERANDQLDKLNFDIQAFTSSDGTSDTGIMKLCKDIRKKNYKQSIPRIIKKLGTRDILPKMHQTHKFRDELVELCWLMSIQDPPVVVDCIVNKQGEKFNKAVLKAYTQSGKLIDFVVWPALYLHDGGPLLCKGVVQCTAKNRQQEEENVMDSARDTDMGSAMDAEMRNSSDNNSIGSGTRRCVDVSDKQKSHDDFQAEELQQGQTNSNRRQTQF